MTLSRLTALLSLALAACAEGPPSPVAPPAPSPSVPPAQSEAHPSPDPSTCPIHARFALGDAYIEEAGGCDVRFVAVARGTAAIGTDTLAEGDALIAHGEGELAVHGNGMLFLATYHPDTCLIPLMTTRRIVRAGDAPDLAFAGGAMHARLDIPDEPGVYFGRLSGTAPVAEHRHEGSWEVIGDIEAAGAFTLSGVEQRLGPQHVVIVPPWATHSWKPDAGSTLVAFQLYTPPGPEQRFKKLAAAK